MANGNGNGLGGIKVTQASLAIFIALSTPIATAAVVQYRVQQSEREQAELRQVDREHEERIRAVENAVARFTETTEAVRRQTNSIEVLQKEVAELGERTRPGRTRPELDR